LYKYSEKKALRIIERGNPIKKARVLKKVSLRRKLKTTANEIPVPKMIKKSKGEIIPPRKYAAIDSFLKRYISSF
tara:strand:+ start:327 stop:551 length:225 start_codon:yes stop_codon:yes gene_type:complete